MECKVYMGFYMASNGYVCMVTWPLFKILSLGGRPNTKPGDRGTLNAHNRWFILFRHVWGHAWIKTLIKIAFGWGPGHIWLHTTLEGPWPHFGGCFGTAFGHFFLGSHNFMVTALGLYVKWPLKLVGAHTNILFIIKVKTLILIKWSHRFPQLR
jgi:hypothetical protein